MNFVTKNFIVGLYAIAWTAMCNAETSSSTSADVKVAAGLVQQNACKAISPEDMAKALQWASSEITSESMTHKDGKRSLCRFNHGTDNLWLRLGWKSEVAASTKVLEKQFQSYLSDGENGIVYESVSSDTELLGVKAGNDTQPTLYVYRMRYGNDAEMMFELNSSSMTKKTALNGFKTLASKL